MDSSLAGGERVGFGRRWKRQSEWHWM